MGRRSRPVAPTSTVAPSIRPTRSQTLRVWLSQFLRNRPKCLGMIEQKLGQIAIQYDALQAELLRPETASDPAALKRLGQELAQLEPVVAAWRELLVIRKGLAEALEMRDSGDDDMHDLAQEEVRSLEVKAADLVDQLRVLLLPRDPLDEKNVILEIRAGTGGEEAGLFGADLFRMYTRLAERKGWKLEILSHSATGIGGLKEIIASISGDQVYSQLKYESGVHRVQRVPATESQGRIHTSAVTVAVLPEAEEVDVQINPEELRIDVFRSSGPGGQSVNTTDSAVRITQLPT